MTTVMTLRWNSDRGSIPLAMLGAIIASGIVISLGSVMVNQTAGTRFDRDYTQAVQVADAGVQEAVFMANNLGDPATCTSAAPCTGTVDGSAFRWSATPIMQGPILVGYDVTSSGAEKGRTRKLKAELVVKAGGTTVVKKVSRGVTVCA